MKNFGEVLFRVGAKGFLSATGAYGYWYPDTSEPVTIKKEILGSHMYLWRNQGDYLAFRIPAGALNLRVNLADNSDVCVWFTEKALIQEKALIDINPRQRKKV